MRDKGKAGNKLSVKVLCALTIAAMLCSTAGCAGSETESMQVQQTQQATSEPQSDTQETEAQEVETQETEAQETETSTQSQTQQENEGDTNMAATGLGAGQDRTMPESLADQEIISVPEWEAAELPNNEALQFVQDMELGWNLGNTFDAIDCGKSDEMEYESAWVGIKTTKEMIHAIAEAGFRTIRIPVSWHNHLVDENYLISEAWIARVQEVVDWALEEDMYVILNIHHDNRTECLYPSYELLEQSKDYVVTIWEQIAARFADYDERVIFETMNEPRQVETDHEWWIDVNSDLGKECLDCVNQLNQAAVDIIRSTGGGYNTSRYIMVPGYCASADFALANGFTLPQDTKAEKENRILVSVHAYTPYGFALAGETDSSSTTVFSIADKKGTADIDTFMKKLYDKYTSKGIGVVIGEFGARAKQDNLQDRTEFAAYYIARARHYGMTACWWDNNAFAGNGENFGLFRRMKSEFLYPQIVAQMVYYK